MRPRLLDLFSGAGGAGMGYYRAGFEVVGIDIAPMPHYPFEFHQADALEYLAEHGHEFDAIHASPPCQAYSTMTKLWDRQGLHPNLVSTVREMLEDLGKLFVIENVRGASLNGLDANLMLCGSMFGLPLRRHRYFNMTNPPALTPVCNHTGEVVAVYGHSGGSSKRDGKSFGGVDTWKAAMDIDWMVGDELAEAIPPAYTEFIGRQLMTVLEAANG